MFKVLILYFHTVRYLKPLQWYGRILKFLPRFINTSVIIPPLADFESLEFHLSDANITTNFEEFNFLNTSKSLPAIGWHSKEVDLLWNYNLHYFDYINTKSSTNPKNEELIRRLIDNWIEENPFGQGVGWEPYPTSIRIINWTKWHYRTKGLSSVHLLSLWNQLRWLSRNLEYHLLGNHLFSNAKALFFGSSLFLGPNATAFSKKATALLTEQLSEQFLADGAHFEISPMYHSLAVLDLTDLYFLNDKVNKDNLLSKILESRLKNGISWLSSFQYKNGELANFNDCSNGIAPNMEEHLSYLKQIGFVNSLPDVKENQLVYLEDSGFILLQTNEIHLIADVGKIGPDYLPGHAHADTLSFELAVNDDRLIVNSGTSVYGSGAIRQYQRSTASHSTVQISDEDSSEVWGGFRVARRAHPFGLEIIKNQIKEKEFQFKCAHSGYLRLKTRNIHERIWSINRLQIEITDRITGDCVDSTARYFLHPNISIRFEDKHAAIATLDGKFIAKFNVSSSRDAVSLQLRESMFFPKFGVQVPNQYLEVRFSGEYTLTICYSSAGL